jgi:hypothetical protein
MSEPLKRTEAWRVQHTGPNLVEVALVEWQRKPVPSEGGKQNKIRALIWRAKYALIRTVRTLVGRGRRGESCEGWERGQQDGEERGQS